MIISESREKMKKMVRNFSVKLRKDLTRPQGKFVMEILMGMLMTGSSNLTRIARSLKEKAKTKHTLKRLLRMSDITRHIQYVREMVQERQLADNSVGESFGRTYWSKRYMGSRSWL